jgi:hypothetical protein
MKKIAAVLIVVLATASMISAATITNTVKWNVPFGDRFRERCIEVLDAVVAQLNTDTTAISTALATNVTKGSVAQVDTNTVTTTTLKTPAHIGQLLVGGAAAQYDAMWYAKGTTTNDWVRVVIPTGAMGQTNITFTSTLQTNVLSFNPIGILTNHTQTGP